ncbi:hypothetical protein F4823DRAFT_640379 [Ustulina deusta]|nr:hypothetical protein F4823DRAFT_640379 [Ustulina deusta]
MESACDLEAAVPQRPLELHDSSQFLAQPLGSPAAKPKRPKHDGLYSQILKDRREDGQEPTADDEFYDSYDVEQITVNGFPSIAALHARYPNTRTCRSFDYLNQRLTITYQYQLTCLLGALADLDVEDATKSETQGEKGSQPVPFDKEKFISRCLRSADQTTLVQIPSRGEGCEEDEGQKKDRVGAMRENIIANMERILEKYCTAIPVPFAPSFPRLANPPRGSRVSWQYELRKFPRASAKTHCKLFKEIKEKSGLDPDALDYLRADDDFIYADADPLYERFYSLLIDVRAAFVVSYLVLCLPFGVAPIGYWHVEWMSRLSSLNPPSPWNSISNSRAKS